MADSEGGSPPETTSSQGVSQVGLPSINVYSSTDQGPYFVHIEFKKEHITPSLDENIPLSQALDCVNKSPKSFSKPIHPMIFGKFIFQKMKTYQHTILGITGINKFKLRVQCQTHVDANSFVIDPILGVNNFIAYIPFFLTTKTGIIRNFTTELD